MKATIFYSGLCKSINNHSPYICVAKNHQIKGLKSCLTFLRCFGADLSEITVQWHTWAAYKSINPTLIPKCKCHTRLDQYINRYCAESLSTITFYDKFGFSIENYVKPFVEVDTIRLLHCGLEQKLPKFNDWFPNLSTLDINQGCTYEPFANIQLHFTHLQHLTIHVHENDERKISVKHLLHANPQLQSLSLFLHKRMKMSEFLDMISGNPSISKLSLNPLFCESCDAIRFADNHPLTVELEIMEQIFTVDDAVYLIQHLHSLKTFKFGFKTTQDRMEFQTVLSCEQLPWVKEWKYHNVARSFDSLTRK